MVEVGGRAGWARGVGVSVLLSAVVSAVACGGRTSAIDVDVYTREPDGSAGTSAQGGSSSPLGGTSNTSAGTFGNVGAATSTGGASSVDRDLSETTCEQYCPGYGAQCKQRLAGKDCLAVCRAELNDYGAYCQQLGVAALQCLTPFFSPSGGDCDVAVRLALTRCEAITTKFTDCKASVGGGSGQAVPPLPPVSSCPHMGDNSGASCVELFDCDDGPYIVDCGPPDGGSRQCSCLLPWGTNRRVIVPDSATACIDAAAVCR